MTEERRAAAAVVVLVEEEVERVDENEELIVGLSEEEEELPSTTQRSVQPTRSRSPPVSRSCLAVAFINLQKAAQMKRLPKESALDANERSHCTFA